MSAVLRKYEFPTSPSAYDFPDLNLPDSNPYAMSARAAGVKQNSDIEAPMPDFLVTRLDKNIVTLERLKWNRTERRLSRDMHEKGTERVGLDFKISTK